MNIENRTKGLIMLWIPELKDIYCFSNLYCNRYLLCTFSCNLYQLGHFQRIEKFRRVVGFKLGFELSSHSYWTIRWKHFISTSSPTRDLMYLHRILTIDCHDLLSLIDLSVPGTTRSLYLLWHSSQKLRRESQSNIPNPPQNPTNPKWTSSLTAHWRRLSLTFQLDASIWSEVRSLLVKLYMTWYKWCIEIKQSLIYLCF